MSTSWLTTSNYPLPTSISVWESLVIRLLREQETVGSIPTRLSGDGCRGMGCGLWEKTREVFVLQPTAQSPTA